MVNYFLQTRIIYIILFLVIASCAETKHEKHFYGDLGEIPFNEQFDDKRFKVCHEDLTLPFNYAGFGLVYEGEKKKLVEIIQDQFNYPETIGQTGYITIRFIINCEGKTGRFRITETDTDLKEKKFDNDITNQILTITKELDGWQPLKRWEKVWDVQQYLTFKFKDGVITDILP